MAKLWMGPTGNIIEGHVLDCNKKSLERALKDYDDLLYIRWNPKKLKKHGLWEIRRRPLLKTVKQIVEYNGASFVDIGYKEQDLVHHVLDAPYLNYSILTKLQDMDMFRYNPEHFGALVDSNMDSFEEKQKDKARKEMMYQAKQNRRAFQELREMVLAGWNPASIADVWDRV